MRKPVRRSLVLATLAALLLGVVGISAPTALAAPPATNTRVAGINIDATTIPQLQALMNRHRLSSVQLVQFYLHRIARLNPALHAVIKVNPQALALARAADAARRRGDRRPLLGIPVLVKDNVDTTGMPTTAGSWALAGSNPHDAFLIKRLKAAGAIIIAKANLSEWANFRSGPSSSGWTGIGGQTNLAYVLDRNPCGSSSGTGVGISADLATVGVGTETDGSIVCPSGANGLVGVKPTLGLWSRSGIVPISADQDTAGPMARNVTDAAVLLGAGVGVDRSDPATEAQKGHASRDYTQFLDKHALDGARIGVWHSYDLAVADPGDRRDLRGDRGPPPEPRRNDRGSRRDRFRQRVSTTSSPPSCASSRPTSRSYLADHTEARYPKTLQALIDFNNAHPELEGPWNNLVFDLAEATAGRDADCATLRAATTPVAQAAIDDVMAANHLDAIVAPTNNPAWVTDPVNGDSFDGFVSSSSPSAVSGYGSVTVPMGFVGPLPVGLSFIGGRWSEPDLLAYAYAFEQATHVRTPPQFLASTSSAAAAATRRAHGSEADRRDRLHLPPR